MSKKHSKPEFQVIRQNDSNSKFFVASGGDAGFTGDSGVGPGNSASHYGDGSTLDM